MQDSIFFVMLVKFFMGQKGLLPKKATIAILTVVIFFSGYPAQSDVTAEQPVGYAAAYAAAKQRIAHIRSTRSDLTNNIPVVAVEGFLQETVSDR